ncbi:putative C2 domain-containing protein [Helianthus annuus]|uniref:C2 domain-containing protein n=1 Tax=Helianthus annuus TaxID=4232 RepID=A0A251VK28_HELAN|nr:protein C2-DOMAIN ABA-RELATED 3 [Helianthus annuus]KAF5767550.1 putative C2 domain-containing protein [Helianthus annuus]KAJ0463078.1 putative C2 domain-containing protein [Helianthus annuus]KAJ0466892.1 putative C2 domain-containing protein [Helianthus annuus]KAJ0484444.1 putative C2 domain-containing protein [Helianthus annuus]KAJ0654997.1 putative C2 domain-containing protein [Helianthus annuus]
MDTLDNLLGLLKIKVKRGINLVIRDFRSSDPYCVFKMGEQRLKTHIIYGDLNPVWDQDLTLSIEDPDLPIELLVFDHDTFTRDDEMGDADFDIQPFLEALKMHLDTETVPDGTIIKRIEPSRSNCLSEESCVMWKDGQIVQNMLLRLRNVESGEIEIELHWIDIPGAHHI